MNLENILNFSDSEYQQFGLLLFQKDYSSEALSFIQNHARTLNYWGEGQHNLLPLSEEAQKRRRYSFMDLVWLGIVQELREMGMEKEEIFTLKESLLAPTTTQKFIKSVQKDKAATIEVFTKHLGLNPLQAQGMLEKILAYESQLEALQLTPLYEYVIWALARKTPLYLLIDNEGRYCTFYEERIEDLRQEPIKTFFRNPHRCILLNGVVSHFVASSHIRDDIKEKVFSPQEWRIIELIRKEKPQSVTIDYGKEGEVEVITITKQVHIKLEARLSEIMAKGGYEKIEVKTQNGKIATAKKSVKHKL